MVRPEIIYRWRIATVIIVGISDVIVTAAISPQRIPVVVMNAAIPTVMVRALDPVKTEARRYSFQLNKKTIIAAAAIVGVAKGKMIRRST